MCSTSYESSNLWLLDYSSAKHSMSIDVLLKNGILHLLHKYFIPTSVRLSGSGIHHNSLFYHISSARGQIRHAAKDWIRIKSYFVTSKFCKFMKKIRKIIWQMAISVFVCYQKFFSYRKQKYSHWCEDPLGRKYKMIIKYVKISHPSLTHNDKFDKEGYTITLCFRSSALVLCGGRGGGH